MNEELEYAKMLEIPVSTVSVVRKKSKPRREKDKTDIKDRVIERVNDKLSKLTLSTPETSADEPQPQVEQPELQTDEQISTVLVYPSAKKRKKGVAEWFAAQESGFSEDAQEEFSSIIDGQSKEEPAFQVTLTQGATDKTSHVEKHILRGEFIAAGVLVLGIFLTNALMPHSAMNSLFAGLFNPPDKDVRVYTDFALNSVVGDYCDAEIAVSETGVLTFTKKCCVYPAVDGVVSSVSRDENGKYSVTISHSEDFVGVLSGLDYAYYAEGEKVFSNVPVGYSEGETEVSLTMFWEGELINSFQVDDENCLSWVTQSESA